MGIKANIRDADGTRYATLPIYDIEDGKLTIRGMVNIPLFKGVRGKYESVTGCIVEDIISVAIQDISIKDLEQSHRFNKKAMLSLKEALSFLDQRKRELNKLKDR